MTPRELIDELKGVKCRCGKTKIGGRTFCSGCYYSLSTEQRHRLYDLIGQGYEEAYGSACDTLLEKGL